MASAGGAKTDMAAGITDNKSGVPGRPSKVSANLRAEEAAYQRDILGKDVPVAPKVDQDAKHDMTNLLQREEARLARIGQHLDKPDELEQKLGEQTTARLNPDSEFASSGGNVKTDMNMRMSGQEKAPPPASAGKASPKAAPAKAAQAAKPTAGTTGTTGQSAKTDMGAVITDRRSHMDELSKTLQSRLKREEDSYAREHPAEKRSAAGAGKPSVAGGADQPRASLGGERVLSPSAAPAKKGLRATIYTHEEETSSSEEQPRNACWFMPERVQRMFDTGMERICGPRPKRPYRPPMLEMEVEEDDYDPYANFAATANEHRPAKGRATRSRMGRRPVYPEDDDFEVMFQNEVFIGGDGGPQGMYDDGAGAGYDEGSTYDEQADDAYMDGMMYRGNQGIMYGPAMMQPMMQPMMGQPLMQPMMQPMMAQPMMGQPMMGQMGQALMGQPMMAQPMMQAMPYGFAQQQVAGTMDQYDPTQSLNNQQDHIEVTASGSDTNVVWTNKYEVPIDMGPQRTGSNIRIEQHVRVKTRKEQSSSTESDEVSGMKTAAVQTKRSGPVSTTAQTDTPLSDSKGVSARADTDDAATQRNRQPERGVDTQTYGTSPYVMGAGMPFMNPFMNPFMMSAMGMAPPPVPQQQLAPQTGSPPPPSSPPCEECAQLKSCCDEVPFEEIKRNIQEDIVNIKRENINVKISEEDAKIIVARPDSPYKLVYLIPQRAEVVKEEKSSQTGQEDKNKQDPGSKKPKEKGEGGEGGEQVIMASIKTKECQVNGKRVRTTKAVRITQSDDEKSAAEANEEEESSSSDNARSRSKRRSRSKKRAKRSRSDGAYPRSLTISLGRTSSTTDRSRHLSRSPSAAPPPSDASTHPRSPKRWQVVSHRESSISTSNGSFAAASSNVEIASVNARASRAQNKHVLRENEPPKMKGSGYRPFPSSVTNIVRDRYERPEVKPKVNRVFVERVYPERPGGPRMSPRREVEGEAHSPRSERGGRGSPPQRRDDRPAGGLVCKPPKSVSSVFQAAAEGRYHGAGRSMSYLDAERIAKQIAQQIAPQIIAARQKEPMSQRSGQASALQGMIQAAQQKPQPQQHARHELHEPTPRYESLYPNSSRYAAKSQLSLERISSAQGRTTDFKISRFDQAGAAHSLSQSSPQRYHASDYPRPLSQAKRSATMSSVNRDRGRPGPQQPPRAGYATASGHGSPPRFILPVQVQLTGKASGAGVSSSAYAPGARIPVHGDLYPETTRSKMMHQQEQQSSLQLGRNGIEPDLSSPPHMSGPVTCHADKKRAFYKRAYRLRIPSHEKQVLTYALVALVALISIILVINTLGKRRPSAY